MAQNSASAIVIPFYRNVLSANDIIALTQCFKVLQKHPVIAIKPKHLQLPSAIQKYDFAKIVSFDDDYFESIAGYNRLMLDAAFYNAFLNYDYILIYQLDAFVFRDELDYWCRKKIDYVGAPWIMLHGYPDIVKALKMKIQQYFHVRNNTQVEGLPIDEQFRFKVGNGGFSLRNVKKLHELCLQLSGEIAIYNSRVEHQFNEDVFWAVEVNRKRKILKIPHYKTALKFSFELYPEKALKSNHNRLPFGCHGWDLYADFWRPVFKQYGYEI